MKPTESSTFCTIRLTSHKFNSVSMLPVANFFLVTGLPIYGFVVYDGKAVPLTLCALQNMKLDLSLTASNTPSERAYLHIPTEALLNANFYL